MREVREVLAHALTLDCCRSWDYDARYRMRRGEQLIVQVEQFVAAAAPDAGTGAGGLSGGMAEGTRPANLPVRAMLHPDKLEPEADWLEYGASSLMGVTKMLAAVAGGEEEDTQAVKITRLERCDVGVMQASWDATSGGKDR